MEGRRPSKGYEYRQRMVIHIRKILRLLKDNRGSSAYIELAVLILVCMMILALSVSFLGIYSKYNLVNAMAHEIARYVEIKGVINNDTFSEFNRLKSAAGLATAAVSFDRPAGRIQLEDPFTVTVTMTERFGIGGVQVIPVTVRAISTGRSEVFWK